MIKWAQIISNCIKPGGIFYVIDEHPFGNLIDDKQKPFRLGFSYFNYGKSIYWEEETPYADSTIIMKNKAGYEWFHTMSDIINALVNANLELEFLHEFSYCFHRRYPDMKRREDGYWEFENLEFSLPMMFSIRAHKKTLER